MRTKSSGSGVAPPQHLTDRDREEIDANAKATLRDLNASIRALADAEQLRQDTEAALLRKKYARGLGALGTWAAGGAAAVAGVAKSPDHAAEEDRARQVGAHREAVLWFLRRGLQEAGRTQQGMMEARLTREMEKNRSMLAKAGGGRIGASGANFSTGANDLAGSTSTLGGTSHSVSVQEEEEEMKKRGPQQLDLTEEQRQMFEKDNQDMLKHYETTLDKVR